MKHEKIYKREDGTRIKVTVWPYISTRFDWTDKCSWDVMIETCEPGKRKFKSLSTNLYPIVISNDEILAAKLELWEKLKPTL